MTPEKIGRYEIQDEIGRGGMATVYKAYDPRFERFVAIKVLPREFMHEPEFRARFNREAKTIAALEHPAIVPVYDYGEDNGLLYLVMRFMPGGSLADRLQNGPIGIEETAAILQRLGSALDRAHGEGIIHRDLKPSNVLFDQYGDAFLADFGIVRLTTSDSNLTASGSLVGTPTYMSPEQVYGDKELDGRSDIYALGVILFQMLTGRLPYEADTPAKMMMKHVLEPIPQILQDRPDLPPEAEQVINRALAKERDDRFASASDFSSALGTLTRKSALTAEVHEQLANMQAEIAPQLADTPPTSDLPTETIQDKGTAVPPLPPLAAIDAPPDELADDVMQEIKAPVSSRPEKPVPTTPLKATADSPRRRIPVWIFVVVGILFIACLGVAGLIGLVVNNLRDGALADATPIQNAEATAIAFPVLDPAEAAEATAKAALALTREQMALATPMPPATAVPTTEPSAPTPEPDAPTSAPPTNDVAATRLSLAATRTAEAGSATDPVGTRTSLEATRAALSQQNLLPGLFGPRTGALPHELDDTIESVYADVDLSNFVARATLLNPYAATTQGWDFGLIFRQADVDEEMRLVVRSDGEWSLNNRSGDEDNFVQEGEVGEYLNVAENGRNDFLLIASDETGWFFLNGQYIATLDLSDRTDFGNLALGTGFYTANEQEGETTGYEAFGVWSYVPLFGPSSGELEHANDGFIKMSAAGVETGNFVAQTTFTNPTSAEQDAWDWGFAFRESDTQYWLAITSDSSWSLIDRRDDDDYFMNEGTVNGLNTGEGDSNTLTLIASNDRGYFFLNGEFVATLDLADRLDAGDVEVFAAFFEGEEIEGTATGYEDFTIWPLP